MKRIIAPILTILLITSTLAGCSNGKNTDNADTITVMLDWVPNTNHTGLFVALANGYFDEEGIVVDIKERGQDASLVVVGQGGADFGISAQEQVTFARTAENPQPVVAVATILQHNTTGYMSLATENIITPKDFEGKVNGHNNMPTGLPIIETIMRLHDADPSKLRNVAHGGAIDAIQLLDSEIDLVLVFRGWTGIQAELHEIEVNYVMIGEEDERFDIYTPIIISNENYLKENPETAQKFLRAVSRGYEFAVNNPEEAAEILHQYTPETNLELLRRSILYLNDYYTDSTGRFGYMREEIWSMFSGFCMEHNIIERELDVDAAFTNAYLP